MIGVVHLYRQAGADIVALRGVDLDVGPGTMVALLGPSGMGKSTVLRLLAGLLRPSAGTILVGDADLNRLSGAELQALRATDVSYVLQDTGRNLLPYATVQQNVWFAQQARRRLDQRALPPTDVLAALGLAGVAHRRVSDLPRGQQQQVALAAGIGMAPRLLLVDEPTSQLDSTASTEVVTLLQDINARFGTTIVLVTHDPAVAGAFGRTITIRDGRVGSEGGQGEEYAVLDGAGSIQLPPDLTARFPARTRFRVVRHREGIELRPVDPDGTAP
jgi:ABC-type lipoprotein export system ATPase subunit